MFAALITQIVHIALVTAAAPGLTGFLRRMEALLMGRTAPRLLQPYADLARLLRKEAILPESASAAALAGSSVAFAALALAVLLVPSFALGMITAPAADLILIAGLMALARAAEILAALDAGTGLGGAGANRTATLQIFAEPALMAIIVPLALLAGTTNLDALAGMAGDGAFGLQPSLLLALAALVPAALADKAGTQDCADALASGASGRGLALAQTTAMARLLLWLGLIAAIALPFGDAPAGAGLEAWLAGMLLWLVKMAALAALLAVAHVFLPRLRPMHLPQVMATATLFGLLAAAFLFARMGPA